MNPVCGLALVIAVAIPAASSASTGTVPARHAGAMFAPVAAANAKRMTASQWQEWRFLKEAAATSRFESEAARLALARSSDAGVRSFAATLINHHASAGNELVHMLHTRGMAPPMLANDQRKTLNRLGKLQGGKFDREFMAEVGLRYQQDEVQYFEKAQGVAAEPALRAWIARNLPTLRYHLATAERLAPADLRLAKVHAPTAATHSMGAAAALPASTGGFLQLGAVRPIESNIR
jgi:predicted outer membrane protein